MRFCTSRTSVLNSQKIGCGDGNRKAKHFEEKREEGSIGNNIFVAS